MYIENADLFFFFIFFLLFFIRKEFCHVLSPAPFIKFHPPQTVTLPTTWYIFSSFGFYIFTFLLFYSYCTCSLLPTKDIQSNWFFISISPDPADPDKLNNLRQPSISNSFIRRQKDADDVFLSPCSSHLSPFPSLVHSRPLESFHCKIFCTDDFNFAWEELGMHDSAQVSVVFCVFQNVTYQMRC